MREVAIKSGVNYKPFELKENWIDEKLVGLRNKICHGERVPVNELEFEELYNETTTLINIYKDELLNSIYLKTYLSNTK